MYNLTRIENHRLGDFFSQNNYILCLSGNLFEKAN